MQRKGIGLAGSVAIALVAALIVGAVAVTLFSNGISTTTITTTTQTTLHASTNSTVSTITTTICPPLVSTPAAAFTNDCGLGITLGLQTAPVYVAGMNGTVSVLVSTDFVTATNVTYTGFPSLPGGLKPASPAAFDYVQPLQPTCGIAPPAYTPAFIAVYNGSGSPLQLSNAPASVVNCISSSRAYYQFEGGKEVLNATITLGGYWTSTDTSEPWINATYSQFPPGNYTVLAFDPWQQLTELSFTVTGVTTPAGDVAVTIPNGARSNTSLNFEPADLRVVIGVNNSILFTNDDTSIAKVESTSWPSNSSGFETGTLNFKQSSQITLTAPGVYNYEDIFDPVWLKGTNVVEPLPLQLRVNLNSSTIQTGGGILAEISLFNPLGVNVTVSPDDQTDNSIMSWNTHDFECGGLAASNPTWSLAGYALFEGHFTSANLSSAGTPLNLVAPLVIECPSMPNPSTVVFSPDGSNTVAYSQPGQQPAVGKATMNATTEACALTSGYYDCNGTSLSGYWTGPPGGIFDPANATTSSQYFHYFSPGQYTLVVADVWGQTTYEYFTVT